MKVSDCSRLEEGCSFDYDEGGQTKFTHIQSDEKLHIRQNKHSVNVSGAINSVKSTSASYVKEDKGKSLMKILSEGQRKLSKQHDTGRKTISSRSKAKSKVNPSRALAAKQPSVASKFTHKFSCQDIRKFCTGVADQTDVLLKGTVKGTVGHITNC